MLRPTSGVLMAMELIKAYGVCGSCRLWVLWAQCRLFKSAGIGGGNSDRGFDIDGREGLVGAAPDREIAHLAFDPALVAAMSAVGQALLQDFVEHGVMEGFSALRGEWPGNGSVSGG
jgi:hypothetical protein